MSNSVNDFIIQVSLIDPIQDIIGKLQRSEFRDIDIKWLDEKLHHYTGLAAKTIFIEIPKTPLKESFKIMNSCVYDYYFKHFSTLLSYFNTYK